MNKIITVFLEDIKHLRNNVTAIVVIMGITIIPALYAWFNIAANWDPYSNTSGISVAVVNQDEGCSVARLFGAEINVGEQIIDELRENDQIGWDFVDYDSAIDGVHSGDYYAAVIIPADFSEKITSFLTDHIESPKIRYYVNEKKNAIAPKITNQGISTIQNQVNSSFISIVTETVASLLNLSAEEMDDMGLSPIDDLVAALKSAESDLSLLSSSIAVLSDTSDSIEAMIDSLDKTLSGLRSSMNYGDTALGSLADTIENTADVAGSFADLVEPVLEISEDTLLLLEDAARSFSQDLPTVENFGNEQLTAMADLCGAVSSLLNHSITVTQNAAGYLPENSTERTLAENWIGKVDSMRTSLLQAQNSLQNTAAQLQQGSIIVAQAMDSAAELLHKQRITAADLNNQFRNTMMPSIVNAYNSSLLGINDLRLLLDNLQQSSEQLQIVLESASASMSSIGSALSHANESISQICQRLDTVVTKLEGVSADEQIDVLIELLKNDPELVGSFMSSPVDVETIALYPIENYGSAMSPFYTMLAIWVGGIIMVALIRVRVRKEDEARLQLKDYQSYFGRFLIFLALGLAQSTVICLGDLCFLQIQCLHPLLYLLAGWLASLVYTLFIYTLTVSFSDVGKAICVILLVLQVAGAGGTFPIEMTPQFFQNIYPYLPFTHGINAMRSAIAGIYANDYWWDLLKMMAYIPVSLILGLLLRRPLIRLNEFFEARLHKTGLM